MDTFGELASFLKSANMDVRVEDESLEFVTVYEAITSFPCHVSIPFFAVTAEMGKGTGASSDMSVVITSGI